MDIEHSPLASAPLTDAEIRDAVEAAAQAPSVHNSQPWLVTARPDHLCVSADPDRRLSVADPDGREMLISCGAAVLNTLLALRGAERTPLARLLPDRDYPNRVATITPDGGRPVTEPDIRMLAAVPDRRTHRGDFVSAAVPDEVLSRLRRAAAEHGTELRVVHDPAAVRALAAVTRLAEYVHDRDAAYAAEQTGWLRAAGTARHDGIAPGQRPGRGQPGDSRFPTRFADDSVPGDPDKRHTGTPALLTTGDDTPLDWLHAGLALEAVLLEATAAGMGAALHSQ
ncbi:MAG TPA: hypothetical protein VGL93_18075, partial [Streptosporangiaceae bacterium]